MNRFRKYLGFTFYALAASGTALFGLLILRSFRLIGPVGTDPLLGILLVADALLLSIVMPVFAPFFAKSSRRYSATVLLTTELARSFGFFLVAYSVTGNVLPQLPLTTVVGGVGIALELFVLLGGPMLLQDYEARRFRARHPQL